MRRTLPFVVTSLISIVVSALFTMHMDDTEGLLTSVGRFTAEQTDRLQAQIDELKLTCQAKGSR